jgi:hypothetical protein
MPEFIDLVFAKTSPKRSFSIIDNELFLFSRKRVYNSGTGLRKVHFYVKNYVTSTFCFQKTLNAAVDFCCTSTGILFLKLKSKYFTCYKSYEYYFDSMQDSNTLTNKKFVKVFVYLSESRAD